jgi:2-phosphoglycerate kinase
VKIFKVNESLLREDFLKTTGFIGPSGTGKSHRASWVAKERGIEYILDDGLLVKGNQVMAGTSAKKQSTRLASIRHALFYDEAQREEMIRSIKRINPESILIIGTSNGMVDKIVSNLGLPEISERIYITDVANEFEIQQAINTRKEQGKHVIPVPTFEIKKDFSGKAFHH